MLNSILKKWISVDYFSVKHFEFMSKENSSRPKVISGGSFTDHRGDIRFVNDFKFDDVVRFYFIKHPDTHFIRAWQAHKSEAKYFYPISGRFIIAWVKIDDFESPSLDLIPDFHIIDANRSEVLYIPDGYANGLRALDPDSELMIFSNMELKQSIKEKIRYNPKRWFDWEKLKPLNIIP